jgi:hypothetical protein
MICCIVWFINYGQGREGCHPQSPKARELPLIGVLPRLAAWGHALHCDERRGKGHAVPAAYCCVKSSRMGAIPFCNRTSVSTQKSHISEPGQKSSVPMPSL